MIEPSKTSQLGASGYFGCSDCPICLKVIRM